MAVINTGRFNRGLQKALGIKGEVVIPDLDSALQAGLDLGRMEDDLDTRFLFGWRSYGQAFNVGAVAAQLAAFVIGNKSTITSPMIAIIDSVRAQGGDIAAGTFLEERYGTTDTLTVSAQGNARDLRHEPKSSILTVGGTAAAIGNSVIARHHPVLVTAAVQVYDVIRTPEDGIALTPGTFWSLNGITVNTSLQGYIKWRERALDPSEVTA